MIKYLPAVLLITMLILLVSAPLYAGEGRDEIESNDTMALADGIDDYLIKGHLDEDDTDDWFYLEGQEGYRATFTIDHDEDACEFDFEVYSVIDMDDDDWEIVGTATDYGPESITCDIPYECFIHVWYWSGDGNYTIEITPIELDNDIDEIEPNDTSDLADGIDDLDLYGYMDEGDVDWYYLEGQEGTNPTFTIYFDDDEVEIDFEIYSDGEFVDSAIGYGTGESLTCEVLGFCEIKIYHWSGEGEYFMLIEP